VVVSNNAQMGAKLSNGTNRKDLAKTRDARPSAFSEVPSARYPYDAEESHEIGRPDSLFDKFAMCEYPILGEGHQPQAVKGCPGAHADLFEPLNAWWNVATHAEWRNLADVRRVYRDANAVERYTVFNIKGK
jgi:hypothetical protein